MTVTLKDLLSVEPRISPRTLLIFVDVFKMFNIYFYHNIMHFIDLLTYVHITL